MGSGRVVVDKPRRGEHVPDADEGRLEGGAARIVIEVVGNVGRWIGRTDVTLEGGCGISQRAASVGSLTGLSAIRYMAQTGVRPGTLIVPLRFVVSLAQPEASELYATEKKRIPACSAASAAAIAC